MPGKPREYYHSLRSKFAPASAKLVIVAESPPVSDKGKYFYNPDGSRKEHLFKAMMMQLGVEPATKEAGLRAFQQRGWVLVDATYTPVNKLDSEAEKAEVILRGYPELLADLNQMLPDRSTPLILVKVNVCKLLELKLTADGFNVVNKGSAVPFPSHKWQPDFHQTFSAILKSAKTLPDRSDALRHRSPRARRKKRSTNFSTLLPAIKEFGSAVLPGLKWFGNELITAFQKELERKGEMAMPELSNEFIEANDIADEFGLNRKSYRGALRRQADHDSRLSWHAHNARWRVPRESAAHHAMLEVAERMSAFGG
jgi:hypothetical protein